MYRCMSGTRFPSQLTLRCLPVTTQDRRQPTSTVIASFAHNEFCPHRFAQNVNGFAHNEFRPEREWFRPEVKRLQSNSKNVNLNVRMHRMKVLKRTRYHFHC